MVKEEDYDDDYSSEDDTEDEGMSRRQQVVHLSQMGSDGAAPQGQPILLQMEFLQQEGEEGGEGENGQVVRKVTRQATLQTTPDGQQIIILQGEDDEPPTSPSKKSSEASGRSRGRPAKPAVEMPLGDGRFWKFVDHLQHLINQYFDPPLYLSIYPSVSQSASQSFCQ